MEIFNQTDSPLMEMENLPPYQHNKHLEPPSTTMKPPPPGVVSLNAATYGHCPIWTYPASRSFTEDRYRLRWPQL